MPPCPPPHHPLYVAVFSPLRSAASWHVTCLFVTHLSPLGPEFHEHRNLFRFRICRSGCHVVGPGIFVEHSSDQYPVRARKVGVAGAPQSRRSISGRTRVVSRSQEGPSVTLCDRYLFIKITSRGFSVAFKLGMQTTGRLKAQAPTKETRAVSRAHFHRRERPPLFPVLTRMTWSEKVVKERKPNPERLGKYISAGIFLPADRRIFSLPAFQAKRHDSAVASNAPVKSSLPSELSLLPELAVLTASTVSRMGLGRLCSALWGGGAYAHWLLALTSRLHQQHRGHHGP